jgi:hypothetical protein
LSTVGLFALGVVVTLIVSGGLSLLVLGAILDGRDEAQRKAEEAVRVPRFPRPTSLADATVAAAVPAPQAGASNLNRRTR